MAPVSDEKAPPPNPWRAGPITECDGTENHEVTAIHVIARCACGAAAMSTDAAIALNMAQRHVHVRRCPTCGNRVLRRGERRDPNETVCTPVTCTRWVMEDPEPQPSDGPDYHEEHAAWVRRQAAQTASYEPPA